MSEPITWADIEPAHARLAHALAAADSFLKRRGDLTEQQAFRHSFLALNAGVEDALNHLTLLHNAVVEGEENAPGRRLEVVLAEIRALGHQEITVDVHGEHHARCSSCRTYEGMPPTSSDRGGYDPAAWTRWDAEVERGAATATGPDPVAAAEARLAQIRALHAEKLERDGLAADVPDEVKRAAMERLATEDRQREAGASEEPE